MATIATMPYIFVIFLLWFVPFLLLFIFKIQSKSTTELHFPPSPPTLPIIGNIHQLTVVVYKGFHELSKYGPILYLRFGSFPVLLLSSASVITEVFKKNDINFSSRTKSPFEDVLLFGSTSSFFNAPYGDYWKYMRKLSVTELLGAAQIKRSRNIRREELVRFLQKVFEQSQKNETVDLSGEILTLTNNSTCRLMMSTRCSGEDNEAEKCRILVNESFQVASKLALASVLGPFKKVFMYFIRKELMDVTRRYDELFEKLLREHEERAKENVGDREDKDLMDLLLELCNKEDAEVAISRTQIKTYFLDLFTGGTGTTTDGILWVVANLINHPTVFKKVREEIESVVGRDRLVEESDIPNLPYFLAVVKETFRLYPPVPVFDRLCRESCKLAGFDTPKGMTIVVNSYSIMRDPEVWDNPNEFRPERFLESPEEENKQKESMGKDLISFLPFGGGRRMCPGTNLTSSLTNSIVAAMVQCFDWKVNRDGGKVNMTPRTGVTLGLAYPLQCVPVVHSFPLPCA